MRPEPLLTLSPRVLSLLTGLAAAVFSSDVLAQLAIEPAALPPNSLGLVAGASHYRLIDQAHTPRRLLLSGTNARFGLDYERVSDTYWLAASAAASGGHVESQHQDWRSEFVSLGLSLTYARKLAEYSLARRHQRTFLGLSLDSDHYFLGDDQIPDNWDLLSLHGAHLDVRQWADLGGQQTLSLALRLPAFVLVDRRARGTYGDTPPDAGFSVYDLFYGGELSVLPLTRFVTVQLDYRKMLSPTVAVRAGYRFRYCRAPVGVAYNLYSNELNLSLAWSF